ncbi:MAG: tetratricopeptide repeat protein [Elusimicrobia bacterium]|nr:tetratricopeptide repeat protein [Elusimicrobiota bacterium]
MKTKLALLILLPLAAFAASSAPEYGQSQDGAAIPAPLRERYDEAFRLYTSGDYAQAIQKWNDILAIDPRQKSAKAMIADAREKIAESLRKRQERLLALIAQGYYEAANAELQRLIEGDASHPLYKKLSERLEGICKIVPAAPDLGKPWRIAVKALSGVLNSREDVRLAHNGLRYAKELAPDEPAFGKLLEWLYGIKNELAFDDQVPSGMKFSEYKRRTALDQIYDGKGYLAAKTLGEILQLEPDDLLSLKRLGSAYFMLGKREQAREAWTKALQFSPDDPQLKKFLRKLDERPAAGAE